MFLKQASKVSYKITFWYLSLLLITTTGLFFTFYALYSRSLLKNDHSVIEEKMRIYEKIVEQSGVSYLNNYLNDENNEVEGRSDFFVFIFSPDNKKILQFPVNNQNLFNLNEITPYLVKSLNNFSKFDWQYIKTNSKDSDLEIHRKILDDGNYIIVGLKVDDRDELLESFFGYYLILLILAIFFGGVGGIFLSSKTLRPIRDLIETIKAINTGVEKEKIEVPNTNDELSELMIQFNLMLDQVEKTNQSMRSTLDVVSHEMRTPLTSFRAMAEMALNSENPTELKNSLRDLIEGVDEILLEFKMMNEITAMETGVTNLNRTHCDLNEIILKVIDLYDFVADEKDVKIEFIKGAQVFINCDSRKIKQAFANILDNAIKYSIHHSTIEILIKRIDGKVQILFKDQGIGIPETDLPFIFKRLYRAENSRKEKGIGLGLSLVKSIIMAHQGQVFVSSQVGVGTIVTVELPL